MPFYEMLPGGMPAGLQSDMDAILNKKWGTSTTYPPEDWPETVNLMGPLPERTISGSIVTFSDGADAVLLKSCAVTIAPTLDGVSSVDVVHTGLQMLPVTIPTNGSGITYTDNGDGTFNASGQATSTISNRYVFTSSDMNTLKRGETYYISGCPSGGASNTYKLQVWNSSTSSQLGVDYGNGGSFTMPTEGTINVRFVIYSGQNVDFTVKPMITAVQTTEHEQYNGTTHTANLGRTIYGGEVDVVNGTGTDENELVPFSDCTWAVVTSYQSNFNADNGIISLRFGKNAMATAGYAQTVDGVACNVFDNNNRSVWNNASRLNEIGYIDGISVNLHYSDIGLSEWTSNASDTLTAWRSSQLYQTGVFSLVKATPETFTFTPTPIISRLGDNTLWADTGDLSVTYRRDIDLALAQ